MDRRLLFPALAASAWAQQAPQPAQPAVEALRDRVQQYYQLMVDKKYRQAEAMVAEDSKEDYYNSKKPDLKGFGIMSLDLTSEKTAKVTIRAKVLLLMPGAGAQIFDMPTPTYWKVENGSWSWYIPDEVRTATPFGKMQNNPSFGAGMDMKGAAPGGVENPDVGALVNKITIDRISIALSAKEPEQAITITNGLPGPINLSIDPHVKTIKGINVIADKLHLEAGEKSTLKIRRVGQEKVLDFVPVTAEPFHRVFNIQVRAD
ncbi:MAG TPA: hypothetical protein VNH18_28535 [Bryobacteraceae bacterium]|nr:hypothetical protein [Bryobacteraceae bacterium]